MQNAGPRVWEFHARQRTPIAERVGSGAMNTLRGRPYEELRRVYQFIIQTGRRVDLDLCSHGEGGFQMRSAVSRPMGSNHLKTFVRSYELALLCDPRASG